MRHGIAFLLLAILLNPALAQDDQYGAPDGSGTTATAPPPGTPELRDSKQRCQEEWRKYRQSQACFAPYRLANGHIRLEAFKHCKEMKQPDFCD